MDKKEIEQEELYWEWVIALENGDTNADFFSWGLQRAISPLIDLINITFTTIWEDEKNGE